jgi:hypothetical protein
MATITNVIKFEQEVLKTLGNPTSELIIFYRRIGVKYDLLKPVDYGFDYAFASSMFFYTYTN